MKHLTLLFSLLFVGMAVVAAPIRSNIAGFETLANKESPKEITVRSYVQDGLLAMYDGEFNDIDSDGSLVHNSTAVEWKDISGNGYHLMAYRSGYKPCSAWQDNYAVFRRQTWCCFATSQYLVYPDSLPYSTNLIKHVSATCCWEDAGTLATAMSYDSHSAQGGGWIWQIFRQHNKVDVLVIQGNGLRNLTMTTNVSYVVSCNLGEGIYLDGMRVVSCPTPRTGLTINKFFIGASCNADGKRPDYYMYGRVYNVRIYSRALTAKEIEWNTYVDKVRFGL